jgi:serine/threonine-protein kinase RsbW
MKPKEIKLIIDSKLEDVALVGREVNKLCSAAGRPFLEASDVELCVVEAVTNSIEHAYRLKAGHQVEVTFAIYSDELIVGVCDTGEPMDPKLLEEKDASFFLLNPDDLGSIPEGGRGLAIIKEIMDSVAYTSKEGKNCFTMKKKLVG